jgi:hypothetical protein
MAGDFAVSPHLQDAGEKTSVAGSGPKSAREASMSEAELMQGLYASIQAVSTIVSLFFALVSAYIAGLHYFLSRAPLALRLIAFFLLSIGLAFLGGAAAIQQSMQTGLFAALAKLSQPTIPVESLRNPIPVVLPFGLSLQDVGTAIGWTTAGSVYLALGYMTFFYRWK